MNFFQKVPEKRIKKAAESRTAESIDEVVAYEVKASGFPISTSTAAVKKHFIQFGDILKIVLPTKTFKNQKVCKGNAFISFKTPEGLDAALACEEQEVGFTCRHCLEIIIAKHS